MDLRSKLSTGLLRGGGGGGGAPLEKKTPKKVIFFFDHYPNICTIVHFVRYISLTLAEIIGFHYFPVLHCITCGAFKEFFQN